MNSLLNDCKITPVLGYYAAGQTKRTSDIVDMTGYEGVAFIALLGTVLENGTIDVFVEQHTLNQTSGMARLATTTAYTVTAADALVAKSAIVVDVFQPRERYLQCNVTPAVANAVILGVLAIQYRGEKLPAALTTLLKSTFLQSPAEA
jgi:hypothetical protein